MRPTRSKVVTLPDGGQARLFYVGALPEPGPSANVCCSCRSPMVQPEDWRYVRDGNWRVALHCPSCGWRGEKELGEAVIDAFLGELERGSAALLALLERFDQVDVASELGRGLDPVSPA